MARTSFYHLFETATGFVALGWNDRGVSALRLPDASRQEAERALLRRLPGAVRADPSPAVKAVVDDVTRYFAGDRIDFGSVPVDMGRQDPFFD